MELIKIKIKKIILVFLSVIGILVLGRITTLIFHHSLEEINEIKESDISFVALSGGSVEENVKYIFHNQDEEQSQNEVEWKSLSEFNREYKNFISGMDTLYIKVNLQNGEWTNPSIYLKGIKCDSYEVFLNGRIIYKDSKSILGKDLDLDTVYKDVIIPLGKPNMEDIIGYEANILQAKSKFDNDTLVIKLNRGINRNITPIIDEEIILMGEHKDVIAYTIKNSIKRIVLNSVISSIAVVFAFLGLFFKGRDRKVLLSLSLFTLCMGIYGISNISGINTILMDAPIIWTYLFYLSLACVPYTFAYFFESVFGEGYKGLIKILRIIQAAAAGFLINTIILYTLSRGTINIILVGTYTLYTSLLLLAVATLVASIVWSLKHNSEARVFTVGITVYIFYIVYAAANNTYINEFGLILFIFSLIILTARRFVRMNQDIINNSRELGLKNIELQGAWEEVNKSKEEIFELNKTLEQRVLDRTQALEVSNKDLKNAMEKLQLTQNHLIQSEKMVALGGLVAGVSHEINTPVGVSVTAASHLQEKTKEITNLYKESLMKKSDLEKYLSITNESSEVILSNLQRASELVKSFKQVAVDQSNEEKRNFRIKDYVYQVLLSLKPKLKKTKITVGVNCDEELEIMSFPGALSQIITNLIMNSLIHAFDEGQEGTIIFDIERQGSHILFTYSDNGKGIRKDIISKIFDPFFTTKRGKGGTGLGLNIVYNIVTQTLEGSIECESEVGVGTIFKIMFPVS